MKNLFLIVLAIALGVAPNTKVTIVSLQASGLTCSMCSNAINKALQTLDFVDHVDADIKTYTFIISCRTGSLVDFGKIKKKVEDAGFSVSDFTATIDFDNTTITADQPVEAGNNKLVFPLLKETNIAGTKKVRLLDKGFVTMGEYKREPLKSLPAGFYHATF